MQLSKLEADAEIDVPRPLGAQIKALARDPRYALFWEWFTEDTRRLSYRPGYDDALHLTVWFEGRRFKPEIALRVVARPMLDKPAPEPRPRTQTERRERRLRTKQPKG